MLFLPHLTFLFRLHGPVENVCLIRMQGVAFIIKKYLKSSISINPSSLYFYKIPTCLQFTRNLLTNQPKT
ncbi:hypothetical protein DHB64_15285 [Antarcticibacterium sp. W02-3]|nr:hypothetical protein [Antarcticibacterium sp. W02-3]